MPLFLHGSQHFLELVCRVSAHTIFALKSCTLSVCQLWLVYIWNLRLHPNNPCRLQHWEWSKADGWRELFSLTQISEDHVRSCSFKIRNFFSGAAQCNGKEKLMHTNWWTVTTEVLFFACWGRAGLSWGTGFGVMHHCRWTSNKYRWQARAIRDVQGALLFLSFVRLLEQVGKECV